jgi:transposase
MQTVYDCCCGIDVHKKSVFACLVNGGNRQTRQFGTLTKDLRELSDWLIANGCQMTAMESTGVYWKPVYNVMETFGLAVIVVNAHHIKAVPGRKTDVKDAEWIADLLRHGLLKASFIPARHEREMREIGRYRKSLIEERAREVNRLNKVLEGANIKLSSCVSSVVGKSGLKIINGLLNDNVGADNIDTMLYGNAAKNSAAILEAVNGVVSALQKKLLKGILDHIEDMSKRISEFDEIIDDEMRQFRDAKKKLKEIPGVGERGSETILTEIGNDMSRFPTAGHLTSWAGLCPGNNESAGKRKSGRTRKGNKTLKATLIQCAKSAVRNKSSFFYAQYQRLKARRGANRATVAVAHSMLIAVFNILKFNIPFNDLGADYYDNYNQESKIRYHLKKLSELGFLPAS